MDEKLHPTFNWLCDYLSMLGSSLIHVSKRGPCCFCDKGESSEEVSLRASITSVKSLIFAPRISLTSVTWRRAYAIGWNYSPTATISRVFEGFTY